LGVEQLANGSPIGEHLRKSRNEVNSTWCIDK